jgi:hypothetical protein
MDSSLQNSCIALHRQLLPIPAVAGETRDLARRDGANLAEAYLRNHPLKAGALDTARSRTAEIFINHFDLRPGMPPIVIRGSPANRSICCGARRRAVIGFVPGRRSGSAPCSGPTLREDNLIWADGFAERFSQILLRSCDRLPPAHNTGGAPSKCGFRNMACCSHRGTWPIRRSLGRSPGFEQY